MITINNRDTIEWIQGMKVSDVLNAMGYDYTLITVTVNEELVSDDDYKTYPVPDNAEVNIFHLAHGG